MNKDVDERKSMKTFSKYAGRNRVYCEEDDPEKQKKCVAYQQHSIKNTYREKQSFCLFNYSARNRITDMCFHPGILEMSEEEVYCE